jgi:hypothetical protein
MFKLRPFRPSLARWTLVGTIGALLIGAAAGKANAAGTLINTGFESPSYTPGPLESPTNSPPWVTAGVGSTSATVQNSVAESGDQAVLVTRTAESDRRWAVPITGVPTQRFVAVDWDMRVSATSSSTGFGPFFGVEGYDADNEIRVLGSLGVDARTADVLYQVEDTGALTETGRSVAFNEWYHFRLVFDFLNDNYRGYVNGSLVATTGFVDRSHGLNNFTDADIAAFAAGFDEVSQNLSGSAVFDNFMIRDGLAGDYDIDGDVDAADHMVWRSAFGASVMAGQGADGNRNGIVDTADYVLWRKNLGTTLFASSGSGAVVVPEPVSILLVAICCQAVPIITRRTRGRSII